MNRINWIPEKGWFGWFHIPRWVIARAFFSSPLLGSVCSLCSPQSTADNDPDRDEKHQTWFCIYCITALLLTLTVLVLLQPLIESDSIIWHYTTLVSHIWPKWLEGFACSLRDVFVLIFLPQWVLQQAWLKTWCSLVPAPILSWLNMLSSSAWQILIKGFDVCTAVLQFRICFTELDRILDWDNAAVEKWRTTTLSLRFCWFLSICSSCVVRFIDMFSSTAFHERHWAEKLGDSSFCA